MAYHCSLNNARGRGILLATLLASSVVFLMGTAVTVALPAMQSYFKTSVSSLQWIVNANLLALSSLLLAGGSLGDILGRKRVFIPGIIIFATGAFLSTFASTANMLITLQAIEGVGSAIMVPQTLAIINNCFPEQERGRAIGLWAGLSGGIAAFGPWLGGLLVQTYSWRAVFLMALPVSLAALVVAFVFIPKDEPAKKHRLDWTGTVLVALGLLGIASAFITAPDAGWRSPWVISGLSGGPVFLGLFVLNEMRRQNPMVPLSILHRPLVAGANAVTLFLYSALNAIIFFVVLDLEQLQGFSPTAAGLALLPPTVLITLFATPSGALADRIGPRFQMVVGPLLVATGAALLALFGAGNSYFLDFFPGLALLGVGMSIVIAPLTKSALSVDPELSGAASGVNNAISRVAAVMAIAVIGAIVLSAFSTSLSRTIAKSNLTEAQQMGILSQSNSLGGIVVPNSFSEEDHTVARQAIDHAFAYAFDWAMWTSSGLALGGAIVSFFTIHNALPPRHGSLYADT